MATPEGNQGESQSSQPVISYDKDLPEVPDRLSHLPPEAHLRKKRGTQDFEVVSGRRPSDILLVEGLRDAVSGWRKGGYEGATEVTERLFDFWFDEDHASGEGGIFRYYFGQREALETLAYLVEIAGVRDAVPLVERFGQVFYPEGTQQAFTEEDLIIETLVSGKRRLRRYVPDLEKVTQQDLPTEDLSRYAFKMATGSGKTVVMAMAAVWSYFHKRQVPDSPLSDNFLIVAPNVIVYQRLEKDFGAGRVFHELPLIPSEWRSRWGLKVILRGEGTEPDPSGNLFLANVQHLAGHEGEGPSPENAVQALLGRRPTGDALSGERPMVERVKSLPDLVVMNDEAHHVHDEDLQWSRTLASIHEALPSGLSLWLDYSATPKDQNGTYFPWIITDYPLAQAVEDRIVKAPLIVHRVEKQDPEKVTVDTVVESYGDWLLAALERFRVHENTYEPLGARPVLFVMAEKSNHADRIGEWLVENDETGLSAEEVLVIHTDTKGAVTQKDLDKAREAVRDIDNPQSKIKVVVSVLMLREGWDVRNVSVILGLRPFTAKAGILPEQAVGRGLRLMGGVSPDRTQTLEVMGTRAFEDFVRELETEGVGIKTVTDPPPPPVKIEPVRDKMDKDITIPMTKPSYERRYGKLSELDVGSFEPLYEREDVGGVSKITLRMEFATTETDVHTTSLTPGVVPPAQEILGRLTRAVERKARLSGEFSRLYPVVRDYCGRRVFGEKIDLDEAAVRDHLRQPEVSERISNYLSEAVGTATVERKPISFTRRELKLSETREFTWRRNLPLITATKTIFNMVATYNNYEKEFGRFLEQASDVDRFAALGTTEQESGSVFRVDYLKGSGAIGFYHPDWVLVESSDDGEVGWIVETKGRVWEDTEAKDQAITRWCEEVSSQTSSQWRYVRINQTLFERGPWTSFADLAAAARAGDGEESDADGGLFDEPEEANGIRPSEERDEDWRGELEQRLTEAGLRGDRSLKVVGRERRGTRGVSSEADHNAGLKMLTPEEMQAAYDVITVVGPWLGNKALDLTVDALLLKVAHEIYLWAKGRKESGSADRLWVRFVSRPNAAPVAEVDAKEAAKLLQQAESTESTKGTFESATEERDDRDQKPVDSVDSSGEDSEKRGEEVDLPDPNDVARALHKVISDGGEHIKHAVVMNTACRELGYREVTPRLRRILNKTLAAEQQARRLKLDPGWTEVWKPRARR